MDQAKSEHIMSPQPQKECMNCIIRQSDNSQKLMNDDDPTISLRNQIKELQYANDEMRPRLQMQDAKLTVEREKNQDQMQRNDQLKQCFESDKEVLQLQLRQMEMDNHQKQDTIEQLYEQVNEISQAMHVEFPIVSNPAYANQFMGSQKKQLVQMKRGGFESQLDYNHNDDMFNDLEGDDFDMKITKNLNMPRKSTGSGLHFKKNARSNSRTCGRSTAGSTQKG